MIDYSDAVGWPAKATPVIPTYRDHRLSSRYAELFPVRDEALLATLRDSQRYYEPLWYRALSARGSLR